MDLCNYLNTVKNGFTSEVIAKLGSYTSTNAYSVHASTLRLMLSAGTSAYAQRGAQLSMSVLISQIKQNFAHPELSRRVI